MSAADRSVTDGMTELDKSGWPLPQGVRIEPLGDAALTVVFGETIAEETHQRVRQLMLALERRPFAGLLECVPAFTTITVYYDAWTMLDRYAHRVPEQVQDYPFAIAARLVCDVLNDLKEERLAPARIVRIPVCYGGIHGPDLPEVAVYHGLAEEEVIRLHTEADYLVYMLGFAPGFAYLGGLSPRIATPRRATPRTIIPVGTVGIAGEQTGVYPIGTPGGWQLIGRTPMPLFLPLQQPPVRLCAGDIVRFYRITERQYNEWEADNS